jgi:hypothetical protein
MDTSEEHTAAVFRVEEQTNKPERSSQNECHYVFIIIDCHKTRCCIPKKWGNSRIIRRIIPLQASSKSSISYNIGTASYRPQGTSRFRICGQVTRGTHRIRDTRRSSPSVSLKGYTSENRTLHNTRCSSPRMSPVTVS